ncbi:MAG: IS4 family transposase [Hyphomicrobiales bacterium]|nr:IS4 family transposase [Hyphomicrobiales bacterium]
MGQARKDAIEEKDLQGFKHFKLLTPLLEKLHDVGCGRDKAGNRLLHYDQYASLMLLYFFNPVVTSLRGIQQASQLDKVQRLLGCPRASLGSLSEAARIFDADALRPIIGELVNRLAPISTNTAFNDIKGILTLVDGSLLSALPRLVEAMWLDEENRAFKLHTHFELLKGVPVRMDVTDGNGNEREVLEAHLEKGRIYVMDRGYAKFALFNAIRAAGSSFVCRIRDNSVFDVVQERELSKEALDAGLVRDAVVQFSGTQAAKAGTGPLRIIEIECRPHRKTTGHTSRGGPEQGDTILIVTDMFDVPPEIVALIFKHRWAIETFFRFFKHVLGCRHLLSHCKNGISIQVYLGIIACLLIALWTGRKPSLRTYEMICLYFTGLASEKELLAHIEKLPAQA